jgi:hypothetical protein
MDVDGEIRKLHELYHALLELINRLSGLVAEKDARQELSDVISNRIKTYKTELDALRLMIGEDKTRGYLVALDRMEENLRL